MNTVDPQMCVLKDIEGGARLPAGTDTTVLAFDHETYRLGYRSGPAYIQPAHHTNVVTFIRLGQAEGLFLLKTGSRARTLDIGTMTVIAKGTMAAVDGNIFAGLTNYVGHAGYHAFHYKNGDVYMDGLVTDYGRVIGKNFPLTLMKRTLSGVQIMDGREWVGVMMNENTRLAISGKQFISRVDMSDPNWAHCTMFANERGDACITKITRLDSGEFIGTVEVSGIKLPGMYIGHVAGQPAMAAYALTSVSKGIATTTVRLEPVGNVRGLIANAILRGNAAYYRVGDDFQAHPIFGAMVPS